MTKRKLPTWKAGDPLSAARLEKMQGMAEAAYDAASIGQTFDGGSFSRSYADPPLVIKFIRLTQVVGPTDESSEYFHRTADVVAWSPTTSSWEPTGEEIEVFNSPFIDLVYDEGQPVPVTNHNGTYVALSGVTVRHAITCLLEDGSYPPETGDGLFVAPIKFVRIEYPDEAGWQAADLTYLDSGESLPATDAPDDFCINLWESDTDPNGGFIPPGVIVWCYHVQEQWFTQICCDMAQSSQSSVSESSSFSSSQSISESSLSVSSASSASSSESSASSSSESSVSQSSASSSSQSSSQSSSESSSQSESSASSQSESSESSGGSSASSEQSSESSGGSSASSDESSGGSSQSEISASGSSGFECVTLYKATWDAEACELTIESGELCWPVELGLTFSGYS